MIGWAVVCLRQRRNTHGDLVRNQRERDKLDDLEVDEKIISNGC
jgi:hypothetical protein